MELTYVSKNNNHLKDKIIRLNCNPLPEANLDMPNLENNEMVSLNFPPYCNDSYTKYQKMMLTELFDVKYYFEQLESPISMDPIHHYLLIGYKTGKNANRCFDPNFYLKNNPDVAKSGMDPFVHWTQYGIVEKRLPNNTMVFNEELYIPNDNKIICKKPGLKIEYPITIFGTCRISVSKYNNQLNHMISFTHCTKVIQLIKFLKNDLTITFPYNILCFRTGICQNRPIDFSNKYKQLFLETKLFLIEICSKKKYMHNNFYLHHLAVDKRAYNYYQNTPKDILDGYKVEIQSDEEICQDIFEIQSLLHPKKIVIISHYNAKLNDKLISKRDQLIQLLKNVCDKNNIIFVNPTEVLAQYTQNKVMISDLGHYTEFGMNEFNNHITNYIADLLMISDG